MKATECREIVELNNINRLLAQVRTIDDAKRLADRAAALQVYAQKAKLGLKAQNRAAEVKIRAERRAGQMLAELERSKGGEKTHKDHSSSVGRVSAYSAALEEANSNRQEAQRWQQVAKIPDDQLETFIKLTNEANKELSTGGLIREELGKLRKSEKIREANKQQALPDGKYRVIYADPPWKYADSGVIGNDDYGRAESHYPTLSIKELCEIPVTNLLLADSVLFLWVTSPLLAECWPVIDAWGFTYKASFVWDKVRPNYGHYNSVRHEFLLLCTRGSCTPDNDKLYDSVQTLEHKGKHSQKPEEFREIIDTLYPHGKRLELFARQKVKGWDVWGNELD